MAVVRYAKTEKGIAEINERRNNLRGKMRMVLILVDPSKSAEELIAIGARIGVAADFTDILAREGYIAPVGGAAHNGASHPAAEAALDSEGPPAALEVAKRFMEQTLKASAMSRRGSELVGRLPACSNMAAVAALIPEYERVMSDVAGVMQADALATQLRKMLA